MKSFFSMFSDSAKEFGSILSVCITAVFIAVSMALEMLSIDIGFAKVNFAFLAIAVIGMLFGPTMGFTAGLLCDIVGFIAHPSGGILPAYVLVAGLQGMIYGVCLYHKNSSLSCMVVNPITKKQMDLMLFLRILIARLLDVLIINLLLNTALNLHYGFIPAEAFHLAVAGRLTKNLLELIVDLPLLAVMLPIALAAYRRSKAGWNRI